VSCLSGKQVDTISCGDQHTLVLLHGGQLLSFGRNQNGQLGNGTTSDCVEARKVHGLAAECITGVACGAEHSLCLTESGKVFAWGWGAYGNLGTGSLEDEYAPCLPHCILARNSHVHHYTC
jgi:alpha-tubulin suppressor-like RCC1 family protein